MNYDLDALRKLNATYQECRKSEEKERMRAEDEKGAAGFDAGLACALDLIPREKQKLSAVLHGAYTPEAVEQVRKEAAEMDGDSETIYWLAACSVCDEGNQHMDGFKRQLAKFEELVEDKQKRVEAAKKDFEQMISTYVTDKEGMCGLPYGEKDGCMQGAYVAGYPAAVLYSENDGIYFVGTYHDSLGLEDFDWSDEIDEKGRAKSGPIFGSKQFVKCANKEELEKVAAIVAERFKEELAEAGEKNDKAAEIAGQVKEDVARNE